MAVPSPIGDVKIVSPISTFSLIPWHSNKVLFLEFRPTPRGTEQKALTTDKNVKKIIDHR